ncbi:MAG: 50S ribosomal protein L18a [Nanohaloarchaea archaeon]|nr:50S ribosomal protein L18a [Candidatus Nanohaloarchaea archaeon]
MTTYSISGEIELGRGNHGFERQVDAESEKQAKDQVLSELGSEHGIGRGKISIEEVEVE